MTAISLVHTASGVGLVRRLVEEGDRIFTIERAQQLAPSVGISRTYLHQALHYLARAGWLVRLKKGLYAISSAVPGVTAAHEFEIAMALVDPAAISHWSALHYHGLTEQVPRRVFVLTTTAASAPRHRGSGATRTDGGYHAGGAVFQFVRVKPGRYFGTRMVWAGEARVNMTDRERTLLDGLSMPRYCGDFAEVLHAFNVAIPQLDLNRIIDYALKLDTTSAKRLGWVLEHHGVDPAPLRRLVKVPIKGYRTLDPTGPKQGPCNSRWMIQENLPGRVVA